MLLGVDDEFGSLAGVPCSTDADDVRFWFGMEPKIAGLNNAANGFEPAG